MYQITYKRNTCMFQIVGIYCSMHVYTYELCNPILNLVTIKILFELKIMQLTYPIKTMFSMTRVQGSRGTFIYGSGDAPTYR